jgi:D-glycero-alpha-D-manno-heptose-7-phosphate kinase
MNNRVSIIAVRDSLVSVVIITRTPLRISLGGGGTDLPSYYRRNGGTVIAAAVNKYIYIGINRTFTDDYFIKYSEMERAREISEIRHPIVREALQLHQVGPSLEIVSLADIPSGTGLGSSGTFTVGLLRALYALKHEHVSAGALAEQACHVEIDLLGRPVGKQDQYIAAFGGLTCIDIATDGAVHVSPLAITQETLHDLEEHLLLFFTGYSRDTEALLSQQRSKSEAGDEGMIQNLDAVVRIGAEVKAALERGDTAAFADLMHEHWKLKRKRLSESTENQDDTINRWYEAGRASGARGGKLVGAGGGGFLLFYAENPTSLRAAMAAENLPEVRFAFDHDGSAVVIRD